MAPLILVSTLFFSAVMPQASPQMQAALAEAHSEPSSSGTGELLVIDPKQRAGDIEALFTLAQENKGTMSFSIQLTSGKTVSRILSLKAMPGGTMLLLQTSELKGETYLAIPVEEVKGISL